MADDVRKVTLLLMAQPVGTHCVTKVGSLRKENNLKWLELNNGNLWAPNQLAEQIVERSLTWALL